jgi:Zn-dependent protease with chaperone function
MGNAKWWEVCRWMHILLIIGYVLLTIMIVVVLLVLFGFRMANWVRWVMVIGWFGICFGGVVLIEWMGLLWGNGCRRPIMSEENRLSGLMDEIRKRMDAGGKGEPIRFLIRNDPERKDGSFGSRTIIISSGTLLLASEEELRGILAHELGHLRDGDRILEAAFRCSGVLALGFRFSCRLIRRGLRLNTAGGLLLLALLSPVLILLLFFFCLDSVVRLLHKGFLKLGNLRQDKFAFRSGCGDGLRSWLVRSGLAVNVDRIRRLEKMA